MTPGNADQSDAFEIEQTLPEPLPSDPWGIFREWFERARRDRVQPNPHAMTLATIDPDGRPSARIVLCKGMDLSPAAGYIVFYTNYEGRKARALLANSRAALVMHWDTLDLQVRMEGLCVQSPAEESDAYFKTRPVESRIGAWASRQSRPIASREALLEQVAEVVARFGVTLDDPEKAVIPRPPFWGGFRFWADAVELWVGGPGRVHDRARWTRPLTEREGGLTPGPWQATRLQP
jgi:pyridoxamine 5'-phosphate oxidase